MGVLSQSNANQIAGTFLVVLHARLFFLVVTVSLVCAAAPISAERAAGKKVRITQMRSDEDRTIVSVAPKPEPEAKPASCGAAT